MTRRLKEETHSAAIASGDKAESRPEDAGASWGLGKCAVGSKLVPGKTWFEGGYWSVAVAMLGQKSRERIKTIGRFLKRSSRMLFVVMERSSTE